MKALRIAGLALALALPAAPCAAAESVNLILNWTPTADHSPFYYAKAQGWYEKAGIDLTIEVGNMSTEIKLTQEQKSTTKTSSTNPLKK